MAISGAQKAYLQARAAIARSGAIRSGYFLQNVVITITHPYTQVPTDISAHIVHNGWSISLNLNDEIDTATISLLPTLPFSPAPRSRISIGLGSADNVQFAGIVMVVQHRREPGGTPARVWTELQCVDWTSHLDAHLVLASYPTQSASVTIADLITRFAAASGISTAGVPANLPSVPAGAIINERPSTVLRRITNQIGGGFYLDARRVLRVWSATIPSPIQESVPVALTDNLATLKTFRVTLDASQQRTRVFVEGRRTSTLAALQPFAGTPNYMHLPVTDALAIHLDDTHGNSSAVPTQLMRVGVQHAEAIEMGNPTAAATNVPGTVTTAALAAGGNNLAVADASAFPDKGFVQIGEQVCLFTKTSSTFLSLPGAGQPYATVSAVAVGTQVGLLPWFGAWAQERVYLPQFPLRWQQDGNTLAQPIDTPVVLLAVKADDAAATEIGRQEGSDGYHEHLVQDGRYSSAGALARADAELSNFSVPLKTFEWETDDLNAEPGRMQHIALSSGWWGADALVGNVDARITNVTITPVARNQPPRRIVRAARVLSASVLDVWLDETQ